MGGNGRQDSGSPGDLGKYGEIFGGFALSGLGSRKDDFLTGVSGVGVGNRPEGKSVGGRGSGELNSSESKSLGTSLKDDSDERKSGGRLRSCRICRVFSGIDSAYDGEGAGDRLSIRGESSPSALVKYFDLSSSLAVTPCE